MSTKFSHGRFKYRQNVALILLDALWHMNPRRKFLRDLFPRSDPQPFATFDRVSEQIALINKQGRAEQPKDYLIEKRGIVSKVKQFFRRVFTRGR
jgi:hypothetical protein